MNPISEQSIFAADIARLIQYVHESGWGLTIASADSMSAELNLYCMESGLPVLTNDKSKLQFVGDHWTALDIKNTWGGNWEHVKTSHFERVVL